jgi:transcriptional regulator with XRE-family HTH domain
MSSKNTSILKNISFVERFIEVCGSSQPKEVAQLLNISYQAAKNYLHGRLPDSKVLKTISEKTSYSINWLLTGEGEKFVKDSLTQDTLILSDQMETFVRRICLEIIGEVLSNRNDSAQQKVIVLTSDNIKEEKILDESPVFSENNVK